MFRSLSLLLVVYGAIADAHGVDSDEYFNLILSEEDVLNSQEIPEIFIDNFTYKDTESKYRYDYSYNKEAGGWLKFHRMPATFQDAFMRCHLEGAVLASPLDENLYKAMVDIIAASKIDCAVYTGIHATISKGDFTSIEGVPIEKIPLKWAPYEPDNYENQEDCIAMLRINGTVADVRCNDTYPFICYKKKTSSLKMTPCGPADSGYTFENKTGSCYKFHRHAQDWRRAQRTCHAEGGYLAIVNSDTEMQVLKDLFSRYPASSIVKADHTENAALGFLDWDKKGSWFTVHGQTLEAAGYSSWGSDQPSTPSAAEGGPQYCGSMFRWGQLDNYWCESRPIAFICEKTLEFQ